MQVTHGVTVLDGDKNGMNRKPSGWVKWPQVYYTELQRVSSVEHITNFILQALTENWEFTLTKYIIAQCNKFKRHMFKTETNSDKWFI